MIKRIIDYHFDRLDDAWYFWLTALIVGILVNVLVWAFLLWLR